MRKAQFFVSVMLLVLLIAACAPQAAPAPLAVPATARAVPATSVLTAPAKPAWEIEWERVLAQAKREGRLTLQSFAGGQVRAALVDGFKQAYGLDTEAITGRMTEIHPRIFAERRAGLYLWDVALTGTTQVYTELEPVGAVVPLDPALILPDVTDPEVIKKVWWQGKLWWIDSKHLQLSGIMFPYPPLAVNTNLVKPEELESYNDLLDPKWKGKMIMDNPTVSGQTFTLFASQNLGFDWLRKLVKQEPTIMTDRRLQFDWLAHGKVPILIAPSVDVYTEFKRAGAPIKIVSPKKEGGWLSAGAGAIHLFDRAPNLNTSKIFINWYLSKEGQTTFSKAYGGQSAREDVPTYFLEPEQMRQPGVKYWEKERKDVLLIREEELKQMKVIFGPLLK